MGRQGSGLHSSCAVWTIFFPSLCLSFPLPREGLGQVVSEGHSILRPQGVPALPDLGAASALPPARVWAAK